MVKDQLLKDLKRAVEDAGFLANDIVLSIPATEAFGDYSSNIALQLSKLDLEKSKQSPLEIANQIVGAMHALPYLEKIEVAGGGFINFFIKPGNITAQMKEILDAGDDFGRNSLGAGQNVEVEFISANPTGPLTLGNGRGGSIGDTLANVLSWSGFLVHREYYVNDTGNQVRVLGDSVLAAMGKVPAQEEHYKGEYIKELAEKFRDQAEDDPQVFGHKLADYLLESEIKPATGRLGVEFDEFYSERSVYERDLIKKAMELMKEKGLAYEGDGAVWFKATQFGDEKDRVLLTSEEGRGRAEPTYFLADIAHHLDVLERGYTKRINVLGADHHGYGARIKGVMQALGYPTQVELIFMQFVRLFKGGQEVRMSKRAGNFVTLDELLDNVGKDVARFFFLMYSPDSLIDFNLDLAKEKSEKNPVFYVQYAHARMANILEKVGARLASPEKQTVDYALLKSKEELSLIKHLTEFSDLVEEIAKTYQVQKLTTYAMALADLFHKFYETSKVLQAESEELQKARIDLVRASKVVMGNSLKLMGVTAPERM